MIFNNKDLNNLQIKEQVDRINYKEISQLSTFPNSIDDLQQIDFSSSSIEQLGSDLERYYELLLLYLNKNPKFDLNIEEFKALATKISNYTLSSEDYMKLRDALLETQNYLQQITQEELYSEHGVYTALQNSAKALTDRINAIIKEINNSYSNLAQGDIGRIIPDGAINESYLSDKLKTDFNYISMTTGIYIDRNDTSEIIVPEEIKNKAIVLKEV